MSASAIIMLILAVVIIYGGLFWTVNRASKSKKKDNFKK